MDGICEVWRIGSSIQRRTVNMIQEDGFDGQVDREMANDAGFETGTGTDVVDDLEVRRELNL